MLKNVSENIDIWEEADVTNPGPLLVECCRNEADEFLGHPEELPEHMVALRKAGRTAGKSALSEFDDQLSSSVGLKHRCSEYFIPSGIAGL